MEGNLADKSAELNWKAYQRGLDAGHNEYIEFAQKCDRFYRGGGEQWSDADRKKLEAEGRPVLENNMVLSTLNAVLGEHQNQRADMVFKPAKGATAPTATALSKLMMHVQDSNHYRWGEQTVFADGMIEERGYFDIRMDFKENIRGEVSIKTRNPRYVIPDPEAEDYDPKTWNEVTLIEWMTLDDIQMNYGKSAREKLEGYVAAGAGTYGADSIRFEARRDSTFGDTLQNWVTPDAQDATIRVARIIDRQYRKLSMVRYFIDNQSGERKQIPDAMSDADAARIALAAGLSITKHVASRVRWVTSCDGVTLHDEWSPYSQLTIVPFFAYFRRGKPFGMVRNLMSPQEQLNKLISQELAIINTTANSGWAVEAGSLVNMSEDELEERGAETGLVLVYRTGKKAPEKIKANSIPTGIDNFAMKAANSIQTISGVSAAMLGSTRPEVSGVALAESTGRGQVQLNVPRENLARTRHLVAERVLDLFKNFYTETRIYQITDYADPQRGTVDLPVNQPQPDGSILNDITAGEYNVVISSRPSRDTFNETQFAEALQLREAGVAIPDWFVVEHSSLDRKDEIAEFMRQQAGLGEPTEEQIMMQQIEMQRIQLELADLEATIQKKQSEAQLAAVKAGSMDNDAQMAAMKTQADIELGFASLRAKMVQHMTNLENKLQLAGAHIQSKTELTQYTTTAKRMIEELKLSAPPARRE